MKKVVGVGSVSERYESMYVCKDGKMDGWMGG